MFTKIADRGIGGESSNEELEDRCLEGSWIFLFGQVGLEGYHKTVGGLRTVAGGSNSEGYGRQTNHSKDAKPR